jgi:hypothetical protein
MDAQTEAKLAKLKTQLEDIEGRKIDASPEQLISLVFPIASHTYLALHQSDNDAWVTKRRFIFPIPICTDSRLLDSSGLSTTGTDGKLVFRLRNFLCSRDGIAQFDEPVNVVATPQGQQPRYITIAHQLIRDPDPNLAFFTDVEITAATWNPDGTPAANVPFYWRCRVVADIIIL